MAEGSDTASTSMVSDRETVSSSGIEDCNVVIFCHSTICEQTSTASQILETKGISACVEYLEGPAYRTKLANVWSAAKHGTLRVYVITKRFLNEDMKFHENILDNPNISTKHNTLFLMRKSQERAIHDRHRAFQRRILKDTISAGAIAEFIEEFYGESRLAEDDATLAQTEESHGEEHMVTDEDLQQFDTKLRRFKSVFGNFDKKLAYILITSQIKTEYPGIRNIVRIPWVQVFDFDPKSRITGLLSATENDLKEKRYHTITDGTESVQPPDDNTTNWVFINGRVDSIESIQPDNQRIPEDVIYRHCVSLVDYSVVKKVPAVLVMWYSRFSNTDENLDRFLNGMMHHFMGRLRGFKCIICVEKLPDKRTEMYRMLKRLNLLDDLLVVPLVILCRWLKTSLQNTPSTSVQRQVKTLPKYPDEGSDLITVEVDEHDLQWLEVRFHVLGMTDRGSQTEAIRTKSASGKGEDYLKGLDISWDVIEIGTYDVTRDLLEETKKYILEERVRKGKSGVITIYHTPGGGGSTFAKRLLWEIRDEVPCIELKSTEMQGLQDEFLPRLVCIRNLTRLMTVILLDGKSMQVMKKILAISIKYRIVIVHVKRYYDDLNGAFKRDNRFYLPAKVSKNEADHFRGIYSRAAKRNTIALDKLTEKIKDGEDHFIFEYGLSAFESGFIGVIRYVHGYLQLNPDNELENWHTVLVFLSLANYFGHRGLPCKLFGKILGKSENETVELSDLPHNARQFITEEDQYSWKITHYVVAKAIMEEIFEKGTSDSYELDKKGLTAAAAKHLCQWAMDFIENLKWYVGNAPNLPSHVYDILTAIFIKRNYKDPGENELEKTKSHFSKYLEEAGNRKHQCEILKKLVESFPGDPEFRAHLGRFYAKQADFGEAEKCFQRAITIRRNKVYESKEPKGDDVLERIYNMNGFCNISHVRHSLGVRLGRITERRLQGQSYPSLIKKCLEKAQNAIKSFNDGRNWYQNGSNPSFANLGELKVRLQLTELANVIGKGKLPDLLRRSSPFRELGDFAMESFHECERLLTYCIRYSRTTDVPEEELDECLNLFNSFYSGARMALENWCGNDKSLRSKQCHLSLLKQKLYEDKRQAGGKSPRLGIIVSSDSSIDSSQAKLLVDLYEQICDPALELDVSDMRISTYMMDWLQAIRLKNFMHNYTHTDVLSRVKKWRERKEMGSLGNFYYYILTTLLSLYSPSREQANLFSEKASRARDQLIGNDQIPLYLLDTNEWLGREGDPQHFKRLISSYSLGEWKVRFWEDAEKIGKLEVRKGTIYNCKPHDGKIVIDGGHQPSITVFFVPQRYDIGASHSKQKTRVEFYVGFNPRHGAEAFEVTRLKKFPCPNTACKTPTEISMLGKIPEDCTALCHMCESVVQAIS